MGMLRRKETNLNREYIILLVGKSGTGKTSVADLLQKKYCYTPVESYTTRTPRFEGETGHLFVTNEEFNRLQDDMCAYTEFDGNRYCATNKQVDESDLYVIDPAGIKFFKEHYKGNKTIISIELLARRSVRRRRMRKRGDSWLKTIKRLRHDKKAFAHANTDITVNANLNDVEHVAWQVHAVARMSYVSIKGLDKLCETYE